MKTNKFVVPIIASILILFSCKTESVNLPNLPAKDKKGNVQVLITTPSQNEKLVEFDEVTKLFIETEKNYSLNNLAHTGYLVGRKNLQKVIVLGESAQIGSLLSTLPIGIARISFETQSVDWHVYADVNTEICGLEDFVLNHYPLKLKLQTKLKMLAENDASKIIWYDEDFLELELNQVL